MALTQSAKEVIRFIISVTDVKMNAYGQVSSTGIRYSGDLEQLQYKY